MIVKNSMTTKDNPNQVLLNTDFFIFIYHNYIQLEEY